MSCDLPLGTQTVPHGGRTISSDPLSYETSSMVSTLTTSSPKAPNPQYPTLALGFQQRNCWGGGPQDSDHNTVVYSRRKSQNDYQGVPEGWDWSWEDAECFSHESLPCCLMCYCVCLVVGGGRDWTERLVHGKLCSTTVLCPQPALHFLKISRQVLIKSSNGP